MQDTPSDTPASAANLLSLPYADWATQISAMGEARGFAETLGPRHTAVFFEEGDTLLVSFESFDAIQTLSDDGLPLVSGIAEENGWSHLTVISHGQTWFREDKVYAFFDQMTDDGFFDEFDRILFFGAGPCGYAAGAYSVAAPGARVLMLQPQATLDPRVTEWDDRFVEMRAKDFTDRYGYAPDMIDGAQRAYVLYDPREPLDAMHAALFTRPNVTRFRLPSLGAALQTDLIEMDILAPLVEGAVEDSLDTLSFSALLRARRNYSPYLRRLLARLETDERMGLAKRLCTHVNARMRAPRFQRRLKAILSMEEAEAQRIKALSKPEDPEPPEARPRPKVVRPAE